MNRYIHFLISFFISLLAVSASTILKAQCPTSPANVSLTCGSTTTLVADTNFVRYSMQRLSCAPYTISGTNAFPSACDDCVTGQINIGFPFNFYGNTYTTAVIQSNGIVGFGPFTYTGYMPYAIPANGDPDNYIAGFYADIDIRYGGSITYQTIGTAPNRKFVVSYNNVVPYNMGSSAGTGTATFQIVLNEDHSFHIIISQISSNWNASTSGSYGTSGAENSNGGVAFIVENRNYNTDMLGIVPGNRDCTVFNPVPCSFLGWYQGSTLVSTRGAFTTPSIVENTSYTPKWKCSSDTCTGTAVNISVTTMQSSSVTHCQYDAPQNLTVQNTCGYTSTTGMVSIAPNTVFNSGTLSTTDNKFARFSSGTTCSAASTADYYYDVFSFIPSVTGSYTFNMCHVGSTYDGYAGLFVDAFNPANVCANASNFVIGNDDGNSSNCSLQPSLTATLTAGRTYFLVSTTLSTNVTGGYQWTYTGPGNISSMTLLPVAVNWYTTATGGSPIATGDSFNPIGVTGSGIANTSTAGTWIFYASCGSATSCRTPVTYTITPAPQSEIAVNICSNTTAQAFTPTLNCNSQAAVIQPGVVFNVGALTTTDATIVRSASVSSCVLSAGTGHYVDVFRFQVTQAGSYTFNNCAPSIDAYAILFSGGFNPAAPCASTFIVGNDDSSDRGCSSDPQITATLSPGIDYYLITTSYSSGATGSYDWTYTTTGAGRVVDYSTTTQMQWFTSPSATTPIYTGSTFNPVGVSGSGLANTATAGTTYYYYKCMPSVGCVNRAVYNITQSPTAFTSLAAPTGSICPNSTVTLSASGGVSPTGTTIKWSTGPNGTGTVLGNTASLTVTPTANTTYYVRKESACGNTTDLSTTVNLKNFIYAANGTVANAYCTDNDNWNHYYTGDNIIFSLKGNMASLGSSALSINVNNTYYQAPGVTQTCDGPTPDETFEMARSWNLSYTGVPSGSYDIRFYHTPAEKSQVIAAAASWMSRTAHEDCNYSYMYNSGNAGWYWFKTGQAIYSAPQYDGTHLNSLGVGTTANGINYETLTGITSFSGGSGGIILTPDIVLDNSIVNFKGAYNAMQKANLLKWDMDTQEGIAYYELYYSKNATEWQKLATVDKHEDLDYVYAHYYPSAEINYYYLKVYAHDGSYNNSQIIAITMPANTNTYTVYPNPTTSTVKYEITLAKAEKLHLEVVNILGQKILSNTYSFEAGMQNIEVDLSALASGTYLLNVLHEQSQILHSVPVVKTK